MEKVKTVETFESIKKLTLNRKQAMKRLNLLSLKKKLGPSSEDEAEQLSDILVNNQPKGRVKREFGEKEQEGGYYDVVLVKSKKEERLKVMTYDQIMKELGEYNPFIGQAKEERVYWLSEGSCDFRHVNEII